MRLLFRQSADKDKEMDSCETYIDEKIELGQSLVTKLEADFAGIDGALKTKRNIEKEIKFLVKVNKNNHPFDSIQDP